MDCIVLLGVDGAGKSTVIKELRRKIEQRGYSVFITHFRLKWLQDIKETESGGRPDFAKPWPAIIGYAKIVYFILVELAMLRKIKRRTDYLIFDRNLTDCLIDGSRYRIWPDKVVFSLLRIREYFFPRTKRFILMGDPLQIAQRKMELSFDETKKAVLEYEKYINYFEARYLDTTENSPEHLVNIVLNELAIQ